MEKVNFSKIVYSLVYPDTEKVLSKLWKEKPLYLYQDAFLGSQDSLHLDFKNAWLNWTKDVLNWNPALSNFYPTAGSSEAIRESIAMYSHQKYFGQRLHMFEGDYEGYAAFAEAYGIEVVRHNRNDFNSLMGIRAGERFYISQPSSIDGNVWEKFDEFIQFLEYFAPYCEVMVDLCYVGSVANSFKVDLFSKIIHTVFFSLSKVFGVYYHRVGGVFSKREMLGLVGNQWFKNVFSLTLAIKLMEKYSVHQLPKKYSKLKEKVIKKLNQDLGLELKSADVFMLANSASDKLIEYRRTSNQARICLTPMLDGGLREKP